MNFIEEGDSSEAESAEIPFSSSVFCSSAGSPSPRPYVLIGIWDTGSCYANLGQLSSRQA